MRKSSTRLFFSLITACSLMSISGVRASEPVQIDVVAAHFSPLQMMVGNKARGYVTELVERVIQKVGEETPIEASPTKILPFRRALRQLEVKPNVLFFSLSRTKQREDKFMWVGEVSPYEIYFYKLKRNQEIQAKTLQDVLKKKLRLGVAAASNTQSLLESLGFEDGINYITYSHYSKGVTMLFRDRFVMLPLTSFVARANVCKLGFNGDAIEPQIRVNELSNPLWLVFSKGTDLKLVGQFKTALSALKVKGVDREIRKRYLDEQNKQPCTAQE
jgi:polar amino acid transport system substrate-binding protein